MNTKRQTRVACAALLLTLALATQLSAQEHYVFHATDMVSTDDSRAPQSAFSYDETANTFTIKASGTNNVAFKMDTSKDGVYYIDSDQQWFAVCGQNLSTTDGGSLIWWFNGYNTYGTHPTLTSQEADGQTLLLWDIANAKNNDYNLGTNFDFSSPQTFLSGNGTGFVFAIGLTSTSTASTISRVDYLSAAEVSAVWPSQMEQMGYTAATLTTHFQEKATTLCDSADAILAGESEAESTELYATTQSTRQTLNTLGSEDYATAYSLCQQMQEAITAFRTSTLNVSYEQTDDGFDAVRNGLHTRVLIYKDDIIRVFKSYTGDLTQKESLNVLLTPSATVSRNFSVVQDTEGTDSLLVLATAKLRVEYTLRTGQVRLQRADGTPLLAEQEGGTMFMAKKDGIFDSYTLRQTFTLDTDEDLFGLGQIQNASLSQRGRTETLEQGNTKVCIPYVTSTKGYGLYWDNYSPTTFSDTESQTYFQSTGTEIDYYVMAGENSADVLSNLRTLTGECPMPALWNLGLYQSKERYQSGSEVMQVLRRYRQLQVPIDCIVQDWQYWGDNDYWNALAFLNPDYSNYQTMINYLHTNNAHLMISIWENFGPSTDAFKELDALGRLIPVETYPSGCGVHPYDVYDANSRDIYWKYLYNGLVSKGIDAYWMDSTEPDYYPASSSELDYLSGYGKTWRSLRNAFPFCATKGIYDHHRNIDGIADELTDTTVQQKRVSIMTRSGFLGQQHYGVNTWSGDITSSWTTLANQIPAALNFSACGIPMWNSDTGGFFTGSYGGVSDDAWCRLYCRWVQFSTFCPMLRFHGTNTPREIWQFGSAGDSKGYYDQILKYIKIRYRLLPYIYSTSHQVSVANRPLMNALALSFEEDADARSVKDAYMFGDQLLVAPVLSDNTTQRSVYLPQGRLSQPVGSAAAALEDGTQLWTNFWTGITGLGGRTVKFQSDDVDEIPLYVRAGTILPWGPDVQYATEQPWDSLELRVYPGHNGRFVLYEDENDNYNYEQGQYTEIPMTWDDATRTLTIGARIGSFDGMLSTRVFRIVSVSTEKGTGDAHSTTFDAIVTYTGEEIQVQLPSDIAYDTTPEDVTSRYIVNPSFEDDGQALTQVPPTGWTVESTTAWWGVNKITGITSGDPQPTDGNYIFGVWDGSNTLSPSISQTLTELPAGNYQLTVDMQASNRSNVTRVGRQRLFANEVEALFADQVADAGIGDDVAMQTISLTFTQADNNDPVTIGVTTDSAPAETWFKIDNFRLYALGNEAVTIETPVAMPDTSSPYYYTLSGLRTLHPTHGIYIQNGRKIYIK